MPWNPLGQFTVKPRWTSIPVTPATGTVRSGTGTARVCIETGQRAVLQLDAVTLADGTGPGIVFTVTELAAVGPLPPGAVGLLGHNVGSSSTSVLKASGSLWWVSTTNGLSAPTTARTGITLRGEMSWHIG